MTATAGARLLAPEEYVALLTERKAAYDADHPPRLGFPTLPEWFIQDGDEDLVDMDAIETANAAADERPKQPRRYRPASYWRDRLASIDRGLEALDGIRRHPTTDPAAYGGIGIRQTPRQRAKYAARIDKGAADYVRLTRQREHAARMLRAAQTREATAPHQTVTPEDRP